MADFTDKDKETLERLRKAFESKAATTQDRQPWHELIARETSAPTRSFYAAEIVRGFAGSWASSYAYGYAVGFVAESTDINEASPEVPSPIRSKPLKLGQRGLPDVDFVPYNWRTNRFGQKGPSLVGHPISFEVIGPTLKSPFCDWTWAASPAAGANGGDTLTMDVRPDGGPAVAVTVAEGYDIPNFTIGDLNEPLGGLYVVITDDGANPGSTPAGTTPMGALPSRLDTAKYEIFRVASVGGNVIELHPNKRLADHFDLTVPLPRHIRSITILKPYVTRLAAVPGSGEGVGRERSFVVLSPEEAAASDLYPPYDGGTLGDGSWLQGGFAGVPTVGAAAQYGGRATLPNPRPLREGTAEIEKQAAATTALAGQMIIQNVQNPSSSDLGRILKIYQIDSDDGVDLTFGTRIQALGWFEVLSTGAVLLGDRYILARVAEVDPNDGATFFGPGPYFIAGGDPVHLAFFTVHEPASLVWQGAFDLDKVEALRLRNLIDPVLVERALKEVSDAASWPLPGGVSPARADKAIFDTMAQTPVGGGLPSASDPGSLLDLGFRMVLFPAREGSSGDPEPDFDRPITSREIIIDPSLTEEQYVDIDYSSGVISLSHAPPAAPGGQIVPNGIIGGSGTDNPRNEIVLFAACVPYSMEPSQTGPGMRVAGGRDGSVDAYSGRIGANVDLVATGFVATPPYIGATGIVLSQVWEGPPTGVIEILEGSLAPDGTPVTRSYGLWGYTEVITVGFSSSLLLVSSHPDVDDPSGAAALCVILRRDVVFSQTSSNNAKLTEDAKFDTVYGASQRATALRFPDATVEPQIDGSVKVILPIQAAQFAFSSYQWGYFCASAFPEANVIGNKFYSENGFVEPLAYQDNANPVNGAPGGVYAVTSHGPRLRLASLIAQFDYKGVMTSPDNNGVGVVSVNSFTRYVTKFEINASGEEYIFFTGLIGTDTGVTSPITSAEAISILAPPADVVMAGLRVYGPTTDTFSFFGLGSGGALGLPTGVVSDGTGVYHFVMETFSGPEVRYGLFDANFTMIANGVINSAANLPAGATGLYLITAIQKTSAGAPRVNLDTWFTHSVTRFDITGPPLLPP